MSSKQVAVLEIGAIFVGPIVMLATGVWPIDDRRAWLGVPVLALILQSIYREKWSFKKLGIRIDNLRQSLLPYVLFTVFVLSLVLLGVRLFNRHPADNWFRDIHFQFFFLLTSFFQELAYRGYLVPKLESLVRSPVLQVLINATLFSALHYFFPQPGLVLPGTFLLGVALTLMYKKYPNLLLAGLAHSAINFAAVLFCFVSLDGSCGN